MGRCLDHPNFVGHYRSMVAVPKSSHFASVMRGVVFLAAMALPMVTLGVAASSQTERAHRLDCIDQATASAAVRDVTLAACYDDR